MARLKLTLTMESGARIGPGKAALLESVRSSGSISAAVLDKIRRRFPWLELIWADGGYNAWQG